MKITLLGTGTSQGIPVIGCNCSVCLSTNGHNNRLRTSAIVEVAENQHIQIDCGPDFRQQMLRENIQSLSHIIMTHEHMDHIAGLDDVRAFNFQAGVDMNVYASERVEKRLRHQFDYAFAESKYPGTPRINLHNIEHKPFELFDVLVTPLQVNHGNWPVLGYRIGNMAYITDVNSIPDETMEMLGGLDLLILGVLHLEEHHSHFHLEGGIHAAQKIGARRTVFTHISHRMGLHEEVNTQLPDGIELGYDGMQLEFS